MARALGHSVVHEVDVAGRITPDMLPHLSRTSPAIVTSLSTSPIGGMGTVTSNDAVYAHQDVADRAAMMSNAIIALERELAGLKADSSAEIQRLDGFLVLAGQENTALRRQLLTAGIVPDVIHSDGTGAGVSAHSEALHMRRGLVASMLAERASKSKADADRCG